jgi:DNA-binding FadR family transcriptional regulator
MSIRPKVISRTKVPRRAAAAAKPAVAAPVIAGNLFEPVEREPAYTRVSSAIEAKILSRALKGGDVLPPETDLAQQFRVHRSTVREALRHLESAGLVMRPPGAKRMLVSRPHANKVASGMRHALVLHDVSFVDVWEAMMVIEPEVAALAATRRSQADINALLKAHQAFIDSPQTDLRAVDLVSEFFEQIGACARNQVLVLAKQSLAQVLAPSLAQMIDRVPQARSRIAEAQRKIVAALQNKDADEARKWMAKHVRDFKRGYEVAGISPDTPVSM